MVNFASRAVQRKVTFTETVLDRLTPAARHRQEAKTSNHSCIIATVLLPVNWLICTLTSVAVFFWQISTITTFLVPSSARLLAATAVLALLVIGRTNHALSLPAALVLGAITAVVSFLPTLGQLCLIGTQGSDASAHISTASHQLITLWHIWWRSSNHVSPGAALVFIVVIVAAVTATDSETFSSGASSNELRLLGLIVLVFCAIPAVEAFQVQQHVRQLALERHTQARATTLQLETRMTLPLSGLHQRLWTLKTFAALHNSSSRCGHRILGGACLILLQGAVGLLSCFKRQHLSTTSQALAQAVAMGGAVSAAAGTTLLLLSTGGQQNLHLGFFAGHHVRYRAQVGLFITAASLWVLYALLHLHHSVSQALGPPETSCGGGARDQTKQIAKSTGSPLSLRHNTLYENDWSSPLQRLSVHLSESLVTHKGHLLQRARTSGAGPCEEVDARKHQPDSVSYHPHLSNTLSSVTRRTEHHPKAVNRAASAVVEGIETRQMQHLLSSTSWHSQSPRDAAASEAACFWSMPLWLQESAAPTLASQVDRLDSFLEWTGCADRRIMEFYRCMHAAVQAARLESAQQADGLINEHLTLVTRQLQAQWEEDASVSIRSQQVGFTWFEHRCWDKHSMQICSDWILNHLSGVANPGTLQLQGLY
jgi:hypothetical protein